MYAYVEKCSFVDDDAFVIKCACSHRYSQCLACVSVSVCVCVCVCTCVCVCVCVCVVRCQGILT